MSEYVTLTRVDGASLTVNFCQVDPVRAARLVALQKGLNAPMYVENIGEGVDAFVEFLGSRLPDGCLVTRHGLIVELTVPERHMVDVEGYARNVLVDYARIGVKGGNYRGTRGGGSSTTLVDKGQGIPTR